MEDRSRLAASHLRDALPRWQKRLKLDDWNVTIVPSDPRELRPGTFGNIRWDSTKKRAVIRVLDARHYEMPYRTALRDMEFTVVHELIHLELSSLPRSEASRSDEEHAVNRIAQALLDLERRE